MRGRAVVGRPNGWRGQAPPLHWVVALATCLVAAVGVAAQAPSVTVSVAPGEHTVGDRVAVEVAVTTEAGAAAPRFPQWGDRWGEAEIVEVGEVTTAEAPAGGVVHRQTVTLAAFRTGRVPLPPVEIALPRAEGPSVRLATPADLALDVASVLPAGEDGERPPPKAARPPRVPPISAAFWWTLAILGSSVAALLALLLWQRHRARMRGETDRPALPPLAELDRALAAARAEPAPAEGLRRVSLSLRRYLGRRLGFPAAESTTSEIRRRLAGRRLPDGVARPTTDLLFACDLVKFARRPASAAEVERWASAAGEVARRIEAHLRPAEEAAEAAPRREAA